MSLSQLSPESVRQCIIAAASSDPQSVQAGTRQLEQWRLQSGYYPAIQTVYLDRSLPYEVRQLALILLKNGIDKQWHRSGRNPISLEDRAAVRDRIITAGMEEIDPRLSLHNALIAGKIARFEYPATWPDAITNILAVIAAPPTPKALHSTLLMLYRVIKEYSSHRLPRYRSAFKAMCAQALAPISERYIIFMSAWMEGIEAGDVDKANYSIEIGILCLKILTQVITQDFESSASNEQIGNLWVMFYNNFCHIIRLHSNPNPSPAWGQMIKPMEKYAYKLSKLHISMATSQPMVFARLPNSMDLVRSYWDVVKTFGQSYGIGNTADAQASVTGEEPSSEKTLFMQLTLAGLQVLRAVLKMTFSSVKTFQYRSAAVARDVKVAPDFIKTQLLTEDFVRDILDTLLGRYFRYTALDLFEWEHEPEDWTLKQDEASDDYLYAVRPCAEKLFTDLTTNYKEFVTSTLTQICQSALAENPNVFEKDSIYTALGLGAPIIRESFDFVNFMKQILSKEIQNKDPLNKVIRRRIAILLSQWVIVNIPQHEKGLVYQVYSLLLDPSDPLNDSVVRITAGRVLRSVVDEWDFEGSKFVPFAGSILENLMLLIDECEYDTQSSILQTIGVIVERLDVEIIPFADRVMSMLWSLAEKYPDQLMTKQSIISMLGQIVKSTKALSVKYHQHCFPIVANTLAPDAADGAILTEDVMELWATLVLNTPNPMPAESAPLMNMIHLLPPIMEREDDTLGLAIDIAEAYVALIPDAMITREIRTPFLSVIAKLLGGKKHIWKPQVVLGEGLRPQAQGQLLHLLELLATEVSRREGEHGMATYIADMAETGVLNAIMSTLRGSYITRMYVSTVSGAESYDEIKTSEGRGQWVWDTIDSLVVVDTLMVLSRLGLSNPVALYEHVSQWGRFVAANPGRCEWMESTLEKEVKDVLPFDSVVWLIQEWFNTIENEAGMEQRKVMCLAITSMLRTPQWQILELMSDFMSMWTDVVLQVLDSGTGTLDFQNEHGGGAIQANYHGNNNNQHHYLETITEVESPGTIRVRELNLADPVRIVNLPDTVRDCLAWLVNAMGGQEAFWGKIREVVSPDVIQGLEDALATKSAE